MPLNPQGTGRLPLANDFSSEMHEDSGIHSPSPPEGKEQMSPEISQPKMNNQIKLEILFR